MKRKFDIIYEEIMGSLDENADNENISVENYEKLNLIFNDIKEFAKTTTVQPDTNKALRVVESILLRADGGGGEGAATSVKDAKEKIENLFKNGVPRMREFCKRVHHPLSNWAKNL